MVATIFSTPGTPPQSPHHGHRTFSISNKHYMVRQPSPSTTAKKEVALKANHSPRRASYQVDFQTMNKSPMRDSRRASLPAESPLHKNTNSNHSPIPLGSRPQRATATAPVVGRHEKKDLAGFDPLASTGDLLIGPPRLNNSSSLSNHEVAASLAALLQPPSTPTTTAKESVIPASLSNLTLSPPISPAKNNDPEELTTELRKLAKELAAASPHRPSKTESKKQKRLSLTPKFNLTPPFRVNDNKNAMSASSGEPLGAPHRKMPWQRHRRTKSLEMPNAGVLTTTTEATRTDSFENDATKANKMIANSPITPMMQDLYDVVKAQQTQPGSVSLDLPNLYKPAPTSFLTGTEMVRSSEQDPSPFQMEIPSLDHTLAAARSVQFVNVYRKEDMNFDMEALVGLPRMAMRNFVEHTDAPAPNNRLTPAHRPVVESLLEAADDIVVAGFFASENAGSSETRREAVVLERQMQFVVVFRGTTQEQTGKTAIFKKKDKHQKASAMEALSNDNANSKVYTSVKQAYMELEHRVFECLDKFLDQNPFCDVVFTGSSLGGAMAALGAYRYASVRPVVRVCCQTFGAPKLGNKAFRQQANSLPNLKVMRIEYGNDPKCYAPHDSNGAHVGHAILLSKNNNETSSNSKSLTAVACRFDNHDTRKQNSSKSAALLASFKKERDITSYVSHLEQLRQSKVNKWVKDFAGEDGAGVRGVDNEKRQVV
jgi:hypothetical protein